jgi:hypothetical protein
MVLTNRPAITWSVVLVITATVFGLLASQRSLTAELKAQLAIQRARLSHLAELRLENTRLRERDQSRKTSDSNETALLQAKSELTARQRELAAMKKREVEAPFALDRLAVGKILTGAQWRNVGRATPEAALETALWAAAGGDVAEFANSLTFIPDGSERAATALLESLSPLERERYRTPGGLIAALTIPDVPTGSVEVREWGDRHSFQMMEQASVSVLLSSTDGKSKVVTLNMIQLPDGWKLAVLKGAVDKYAAQLKGAPVVAK